MPRKATNRDRIARLAAEKAAGTKQKEAAAKTKATAAKSKTKAKTTTARAKTAKAKAAAAKTAPRMCLVWLVCDQAGSPVKTFPYAERTDANKEATRLSEKKGKLHFVKKDRAPMDTE